MSTTTVVTTASSGEDEHSSTSVQPSADWIVGPPSADEPSDANESVASSAPEHEPDLDEGEFEGACNVCGGSVCYCARCGVCYCIICEVNGCEA